MRLIASVLVIGLCSFVCLGQVESSEQKVADGATNPEGQDAAPAARPPVRRIAASAKLVWRFREIRFDDMAIEEVFANIARTFDVNIIIRWNKLAEAGIERDSPVSLNAKNLRLSQVIWLLFNQFDATSAKLAYRADRDMILISTADDLGGAMIVRVYDIEDLVANRIARPTFSAERFHQVVTGVQPQVAAGAVAVAPITQNYGSGTYLNSDDAGSDSPIDDETGGEDGDAAKQARIQQLINVITTTVEPDSWAVNGGRGTVLNFRGVLVVRNTPFVHQQLGGPIVEGEGQ